MNPLSDGLRRVCATHGERVAVLDRGRAFTYAELERRVRDIEARLREGGVTRGALVALAGPRAFTRIADLIALFRVGAVPVLLCPRWPRSYTDACLARSGATHRLDEGVLTRVVAEQRPEAHAPLPDDAAYLIYTSGSSGTPKGVLVPHAGLVTVLEEQIEAFALTPASRSLFLLGLGFDASLSDIGTSLLAGATLVVEDDVACAPSALLTTMAQRRVTYADVPPAYLAHLEAGALPACLTTLVVGGEVAPEADVRRLAGRVALFNVYGPTEATICTSLGRCDTAWSRPLLGRPIAGNTYALSPQPGTTAADDEGELLIAGPGLALGYHGDAALTGERFVEHDGRRWFRTGDRVRRHADGEWEFRGRIDRQLKRRGQLVAPEEVEAALRRTGWVRAASVSVSADGQRLLARVEAPADHAGEDDRHLAARLREALRAQLPAGLVPDDVQVVRELPRGTTGKLLHVPMEPAGDDRPAPRAASGEAGAPLQLITAWMGEALGRAPLGPDEDFFDAGGTSLHALELSARATTAGLGVPASTLAQARTPRRVVQLAAAESSREWSRADLEPRLGAVPSLRAVPAGSLCGAQVFLTGATGALGRALLPRLLRALGPVGRVHCVVRRPDALDAAGSEAPPTPRDPRLVLHVGDVGEARFGLAADRYAGLADEVDVVIHLAARLTAAASLDALLAVNLEGTRHALQLCADGRPKALLHASTLSVFTDSLPRRAVCLEEDDVSALDALLTPYAASKWLAERLTRSADPHARAATVVRFGLLTGDAGDGLGAHDGHLARVVRGLARLGALPAACVAQGSTLAFDVTPLDHAADVLLALLRHDREAGSAGTYHVAAEQPATLADLVLAMHAEGIPLSPLSTSAFFARAGADPDPSGDVALAALSLGRALPGMLAHHRALDLFAATGAHFSLVNTARALASSLPPGALAAPRPDHALLRRYVRASVA